MFDTIIKEGKYQKHLNNCYPEDETIDFKVIEFYTKDANFIKSSVLRLKRWNKSLA